MTYEEIVKKATQAAKKVDTKAVSEHIAVEFDVEGEGEGAFYVELDKGKIRVKPYEYYDNDCRIRGNANDIIDLLEGRSDPTVLYLKGLIRIEGSIDKAFALANVPRKKNTQKKA